MPCPTRTESLLWHAVTAVIGQWEARDFANALLPRNQQNGPQDQGRLERSIEALHETVLAVMNAAFHSSCDRAAGEHFYERATNPPGGPE